MIDAIQSETERAVNAMRQGQERVDAGVNMAEEAGRAMGEISGGSERVVDAINSISAALRQQSSTSTLIAENVEKIAAMSDRNATAVKEVAAASDELQTSADSLQSAVAKFRI